MSSIAESLLFRVGLDLSGFDRGMKSVRSAARSMGSALDKAFLGAAAGGMGALVTGFGLLAKGAVETGAKFEGMEARLSTLLGSAAAGRQRMEELFKVASSTPFELDQIVAADVALESFGVNADKTRGAVMDLAGAMGLDVVDAANAVGRAWTGGAGSADILRERGVLAMVELRTGIKATDMSLEEFRAALLDTLTDPNGRIAGGTAKLAATFTGLTSNLADSWTAFQKQIADAGTFAAVKQAVVEILAGLSASQEEVGQIAKAISAGMVGGLKATITAVGFLRDAWSSWTIMVDSASLTVGKLAEKAGEVVDLLLRGTIAMDRLLGNEENVKATERQRDAIRGMIDAFAQQSAETEARIAASTEGLGEGAAWAERINQSISAAVENAGKLGDAAAAPATAATPAAGIGGAAGEADTSRADALSELTGIANTYYLSRLEGEDAILARMDEELAKIAEVAAAYQNDAEVQQAAALATAEVRKNAEIELDELRSANAQREKARNADIRNDYLQSFGSMFGQISSMASDSANKRAESDIKAAKKMFAVSKAAAIVEATINGALAITNIWSKWAEVPPVAIGLSAIATGVTAAQIGVIASQKASFGDTPGVVEVGPTGLQADFEPGDKVVAAKNIADLRRQLDQYGGTGGNGGRTGSNQTGAQSMPEVVVNVAVPYKHLDRQWTEGVQSGSSARDQILRMISQGQHPGQRAA